MKRSTYLPARDTSPPLRGDVFEAARFLRDAARDFMNEREPASRVDEAVASWLKARSALREGQEGKVPKSAPSPSASPVSAPTREKP